MNDDYKDEIRGRMNGGSLEPYIKEIGTINTTTETEKGTVYDFFLGDSDASPFERFDNGEFGGTALVSDGLVRGATVRVGDLEMDRGADPVLVSVRVEELIDRQDPPADVEVDLGDFDQGIPHLRYTPPTSGGSPSGGVDVDEFGRFLVDAVGAIRENKQALREIAAGDRVAL